MENILINHPLKSEDAKNLATDSLELAIDQLLNEGILKDIPIVNFLWSGLKVVKSAREVLYVKKFFKFLAAVQDVSEDEKEKFLSDLSRDHENKDRLFEKILLILEQLDEVKKADYLGKTLLLLAKSDITFSEFYRVSASINAVNLDDLQVLFDDTAGVLVSADSMLAKTIMDLRYSEKLETAQALLRAGILIEKPELKARGYGQPRRSMPARGEKYDDEMEMRITLSRVGEILSQINTIKNE